MRAVCLSVFPECSFFQEDELKGRMPDKTEVLCLCRADSLTHFFHSSLTDAVQHFSSFPKYLITEVPPASPIVSALASGGAGLELAEGSCAWCGVHWFLLTDATPTAPCHQNHGPWTQHNALLSTPPDRCHSWGLRGILWQPWSKGSSLLMSLLARDQVSENSCWS